MRSFAEIRFRLGQELANLRLLVTPPEWGEPLAGPLAGLPPPSRSVAAIRQSPYAADYCRQMEALAAEALEHQFRLLGLELISLGNPIAWRRDFVHGQESGMEYFRRIPYLSFAEIGDHKIIWELNRHQHLVLLAQAFALTSRRDYLEEIQRQLEHWMEQNPVQRGINWASALEVAFRALSWVWVLHLTGSALPEDFRRRWMRSLYHHGLHLEHNLSFYFSPNTHLLGEAVAMDVLGTLLPQMPRAAQWRKLASTTVLEQMRRQVREDGSHFEQSSYYHVYAVDFFLLYHVLHPDAPDWFSAKLIRMAEFLDAMVSSKGLLPLFGDEDGGRLFHPYGDRRTFAEGTLASCARWFGRPEWVRNPAAVLEQAEWWMEGRKVPSKAPTAAGSRYFADSGLAVLRSGNTQVFVDVGKFGSGSAGHSHADTLSLLAFVDGEELLIDPGTCTYVADPERRQRFRGTTAHNTVSIDSLEQAEPQGPFRWVGAPEVELLHWSSTPERDIVDARCQYRGLMHRRSVVFQKPGLVLVLDRVEGPGGSHRVEQRWLTPPEAAADFLGTFPRAVEEPAERSCALGSVQPAKRWIAAWEGQLPARLVAAIRLDGGRTEIRNVSGTAEVRVELDDGGVFIFPERF